MNAEKLEETVVETVRVFTLQNILCQKYTTEKSYLIW